MASFLIDLGFSLKSAKAVSKDTISQYLFTFDKLKDV
jgi:hypothetical protein